MSAGYGYTAVDGYSYVRLVKNELPEIRKSAEERREVGVVKQKKLPPHHGVVILCSHRLA